MAFRVPECYRFIQRGNPYSSSVGDLFGAFFIRHPNRASSLVLKAIADDGDETGWEHVSVSLPTRCPTWEEMAYVKGLFWDDDDCVVQFHPPKSEYVNNHPFCLHLWRPVRESLPKPASMLV